MPRSKSTKTLILEFVMYIGIFAMVGHMCENLYEKIILQSELMSMKSDMNLLLLHISSMELAYDNLREELQDQSPTRKANKPIIPELPIIRPSYDAYIIHKPRDTNVPDMLKLILDGKRNLNKATIDFVQNFQTTVKDLMQEYKTPTPEDSTSTERFIKCVLVDNTGGERKNCKCTIECSHDSEVNVPDNMNKLHHESVNVSDKKSDNFRKIELLPPKY